jgi:hypothetical protein
VISDVDCVVMVGTDAQNIERRVAVTDTALNWVNAEFAAQTEAIRADPLGRDYDEHRATRADLQHTDVGQCWPPALNGLLARRVGSRIDAWVAGLIGGSGDRSPNPV